MHQRRSGEQTRNQAYVMKKFLLKIFNMAQFKINQQVCQGNNIVVNNGKVIVDGVDMTPEDKVITITVTGDVQTVDVGVCTTVSVNGNVGKVKVSVGDVKCGSVTGDVTTSNGDIECNDVTGNVTTNLGDIKAKSIGGNAKTQMGDITIK